MIPLLPPYESFIETAATSKTGETKRRKFYTLEEAKRWLADRIADDPGATDYGITETVDRMTTLIFPAPMPHLCQCCQTELAVLIDGGGDELCSDCEEHLECAQDTLEIFYGGEAEE